MLGIAIMHFCVARRQCVKILVGSVHTIKENAEALVVGGREIGWEVHAFKTKYTVMSEDLNAG